jgi:hypothetical protein
VNWLPIVLSLPREGALNQKTSAQVFWALLTALTPHLHLKRTKLKQTTLEKALFPFCLCGLNLSPTRLHRLLKGSKALNDKSAETKCPCSIRVMKIDFRKSNPFLDG